MERWGLTEFVLAFMAAVLLGAGALTFGALLTAPPGAGADRVLPILLWLLGVVAGVFVLLGLGLALLLWRLREP